MNRLLIATRNRHKLDEIQAILGTPGLALLSVDDVPGLPHVEETAGTFEGNAAQKARALADASGLWTLADDSGLEVDALEGAPGVFSARYAGPGATDAENLRKLQVAMQGGLPRTARFRCAVALAEPGGGTRTLSATCEGMIAEKPQGAGGFGYDPLFVPEGCSRTFAELPAEIKNAISHRARALAAAKRVWGALFDGKGDGYAPR